MSDITDALRAWATPIEQEIPVPAAGQVMRNGAAEIERLQKLVVEQGAELGIRALRLEEKTEEIGRIRAELEYMKNVIAKALSDK